MSRCAVLRRSRRTVLCLFVAAAWTVGAAISRAQNATPGLQPFQTSPTPAPAEPAVRRALPVDGDTALTTGAPTTARAVPKSSPTPAGRPGAGAAAPPDNPAWMNKVPPAQPSAPMRAGSISGRAIRSGTCEQPPAK